MKKSVDKELIVWYIINCQPKKGWQMNKKCSLKTEQNVNFE